MGEQTFRVAVVGAGAAGTLTATRVLETAYEAGARVALTLVDPAPGTGRGVAYATQDSRHLLNVPAGRMSGHPDRPDDFVRWLGARESRDVGPGEFAPRSAYGAYLAAGLDEAVARHGAGALRRVRERAVRLAGADGDAGRRIGLSSGAVVEADAVVLALGVAAPGLGWAPEGLREHEHFVSDPWVPGALDRVPADADVLLVGTGLTACDLALTLARPGRTVHAVSRHGLVPCVHAEKPAASGPLPAPPPVADLAGLRRWLAVRAAHYRRTHGDWRPAVDELRPHTTALWQGLSATDRDRFLRDDLRLWEVLRHRLPPRTAAALDAARHSGQVAVRTGSLVAAEPSSDGVRVRFADGGTSCFGAVVNCTGAEASVRRSQDPLVQDLLATGAARPGPHGLGFDTAADGRLVAADGGARRPVWTLGSPRRGNLWETTAIPEIRAQAIQLAESLAKEFSRIIP
ncbi:FAD/NAD(P)-binding protein [Streptomyces sp. NPDC020799]|uniref:FAD/NAD(P)-binding protein n=1 Tax=Streptomyces sp. NPDC020799 TaxID=3365091 RepID=UPI0037920BD0